MQPIIRRSCRVHHYFYPVLVVDAKRLDCKVMMDPDRELEKGPYNYVLVCGFSSEIHRLWKRLARQGILVGVQSTAHGETYDINYQKYFDD